MIIKTLDELREADSRTLHFMPGGLGIGLQMRPEGSAEFQQEVVARFELAAGVAEGTRKRFDDLRTVYAYGVLCYEIYTLVDDQALLVIEQALRDRFVDYHGGVVTFVDPSNADHRITIDRYEQVSEIIKRHRDWKLRVTDRQTMSFNGMLAGLREWARRAGLLHGQRNRGIENALSRLRNSVAHPNDYHLGGPVDAARTLSDLAEIINRLWGVATPGGRLYPASIGREVIVMAWNAAGTQMNTALAKDLPQAVDPDDQPWQCIILRAVFEPHELRADPGLHGYDARFEVTHYPSELLWGPGSVTEAAAWHAQYQPEPDECDYLDQTFVVRHADGQLYLPMRPLVAAALPDSDRSGRWYVVKADHPNDAYHHVRNLVTRQSGCDRRGPCQGCPAETIHMGTYQQTMTDLVAPAATAPRHLPADVATPWANSRSQAIG